METATAWKNWGSKTNFLIQERHPRIGITEPTATAGTLIVDPYGMEELRTKDWPMTSRNIKALRLLTVVVISTTVLWIFSMSVAPERLAEAERIWKAHEAAVEEVAETGHSNPQFEDAVYFLSEVSGIDARVEMTYIGLRLTKYTKEDLRLWKGWFRKSFATLY